MPATRTPLLTLSLLLFTAPALAQGGSIATAEAFFQDGRALFDAGKFAEACPKLAESQRLDPATGTLLTLALCHEAEGKLATAWAEFTEVEGRARREGRDDRATIATERSAALKPRLSSLTIDVPPQVAATPGLELRLDGVAVGAPSFGVAMPIDGGEHRVEASAPGRTAWLATVTVRVESDAARVAVPVLADAAGPRKAEAPPPPTVEAPPPTDAPKPKSSWMSTAGLVTAGVGVVAVGVGGYLALDAKSDYSKAIEGCRGTDHRDCPSGGPFEDATSARKQGNVATVVMSIGGVALAGGAALWFLAPSSKKESPPTVGGVRVERVGVGPQGVMLKGRF